MTRYICIHGHFYQPPRENPWLEEVELQDSAYPHHDWNERITNECYAPNTASRILDQDRKVIDIVNNYAKISFNFGPTVLSWLERHKPDVYHRILEADKESQTRFSGHGSALAQCYNHIIMPLASSRDKRTQVIWGITDFEHRFKRKPEGMWLPETAVDYETLHLLAEYNIKFTILSPHQASRVKKIGDKRWKDAKGGKIDPKLPYLCRLPSGKTITLFFYDAPVAHDLAFGNLLNNGEFFAQRLINLFPREDEKNKDFPYLAHIATDGETYGHHHSHGDMALAYCLYLVESRNLAKLTIYGEFLEKHPPTHEVEIFNNSSWSCIHGVERWKEDCGCNSGSGHGWHQKWRKPLRESLDWLRDKLAHLYEQEMSALMNEPWYVRNNYIDIILNRSQENIEQFFSRFTVKELSSQDKTKVLKLCEMQRHCLLMYTSCGFFFDEISSIETIQIIHYATRAIQLAQDISGAEFEQEFIQLLTRAPSNVPKFAHGGNIYTLFAKPAMLDLLRVGAHYAVSSVFKDYPQQAPVYCYTVTNQAYERKEAGKQKIIIGKAVIRSDITWNETLMSYAVLHLGDHNITGGVRAHQGDDAFEDMKTKIQEAFSRSDIAEIMRLIDATFGPYHYSLWHLLKDEQRMVVNNILNATLTDIENSFRHINEDYYPIMKVVRDLNMPLPKAFRTTFEFILNKDLQKVFENDHLDTEQLHRLVEEVTRWSFDVDKKTLGFVISRKINSLMEEFNKKPDDPATLETINILLSNIHILQLKLDIWKAQNIYFATAKQMYSDMRDKASQNDSHARQWVDLFDTLGSHLNIRST